MLNSTAHGFLAAGVAAASGGVTQAVVWTSQNGLTWERKTAAQLGLTASGALAEGIIYGASHGNDTVISGGIASGVDAAWLSTDGGSTWSAVTIPADHGATTSFSGLGSDGSGLVAVRPGQAATGGTDGVAYFSPDGTTWQYAGTIDEAGGWTPGLVKGGASAFVAVGTTGAGQTVAYTADGAGGTWAPTGSLGSAAAESVNGAAVGAGGTVIAVGSTKAASHQPVFAAASRDGTVRPVSLTAITGGVVPELTVNGLAAAGGAQIAVGSANGYPAVWRRPAGGGPWALVSALPVVSAYPAGSALTSVTDGPAGWLAVGGPGAVVLTSADGLSWRQASGPIAQDLAGTSAVAAAANSSGYVIAAGLATSGQAAQLWWSPNLTSWTRATVMNDASSSSRVQAVTAAAHEFMAVGSDGGHPAVWTTTDGQTWTTIVLDLPPGASAAQLDQVAMDGNRVVALGQETTAGGTVPFAEMSANGGASWQRVLSGPSGTGTVVTALAAGTGGFTAASQSGPPGQQDAQIWTSATGATWASEQVSGLSGAGAHEVAALIPSGSGVTGIGLVATPQAQQPVTVILP